MPSESRSVTRIFLQILRLKGACNFTAVRISFQMKCHMIYRLSGFLEESEREKGLMIAQLSHGYQDPITSIQATGKGFDKPLRSEKCLI